MMEAQAENKIHMPEMRQFFILIPFALFYSAAAMLGELESARDAGLLHSFVRFILWTCGSYVVLLVLCTVISNKDAIASKIPFISSLPAGKRRQGKWYVYVLFAAVCLIGYIPYYLMYFPTWLNNDAVWQIEQALGWTEKSNHHPYFHTLILKFLFMSGYRLSGTYTGGAAFYTFFQMSVMAMVFAFFLYQLYKSGTRMIWLVPAIIFYAALPINALLTICMGKDEFFVASLLLFAWMTVTFDLDEESKPEEAGKSNAEKDKAVHRHDVLKWTAYFITGLLVCLLRSNGVFIFAGTAFFLMIGRMRKRMRIRVDSDEDTERKNGLAGTFPIRTFLCMAAVLLCYLIYHGPVLNALHVEPPDTIEGLTMPTQHILCAYLKGGELTEEEIEMIDRVVPTDEVGDYYNPRLFDLVKNFIRASGNQQVIADNKWEYLKLWFRVGLRNPMQYMVAEVRQTAGFWAYDVPDYEFVYGEYYMVDNPFGIETQRKLFTYDNELSMHDFLMGFQDIYNKVWSLGLNTWLMVFCIAYVVYNRRSIMLFVPFIMLLITLLLATPVYNEFRYAYGLFAAFPILFGYTFAGKADVSVRTEAKEVQESVEETNEEVV